MPWRHDAAVALGQCVAASAGDPVARSPAHGQEAGASDRLKPRAKQEAPALSRANRYHPRTLAALRAAAEQLANLVGMAAERWRARLSHYLPLVESILAQSERRVLEGLAVPASEKLVSLFEPHADIILKGSRDVQYGHKLNLVTGKSGLILVKRHGIRTPFSG
jgi:hypothetical protein